MSIWKSSPREKALKLLAKASKTKYGKKLGIAGILVYALGRGDIPDNATEEELVAGLERLLSIWKEWEKQEKEKQKK